MQTKRLNIRAITSKDINSVYAGLSDPRVTQYYAVSYPTLEATKEQMQWFKDLELNKSGKWWAVCLVDDTFIGAGGFNNLDQNNKAEIGFWLLPEYWGKGYMQEAMEAICNLGFEELDIHRIEGFVESYNSNCKKAMSKLPFQFEGTMRECELKDGKYISIDIYSRINS